MWCNEVCQTKLHNVRFVMVKAGFRLTCCSLHCRLAVISTCHIRVAALSRHAALAFPQSGIALKLNRSQLSAVRLSIDWLDGNWRCSPFGLSSAASGTSAVEQKSQSMRRAASQSESSISFLPDCNEYRMLPFHHLHYTWTTHSDWTVMVSAPLLIC